MARVAVVGGGYGGLAVAVRLAKLSHEVTLLDAAQHLGGALSAVTEAGFTWDAGPTSTLVPAVVRDLFRKTGRPLGRELGRDDDGDLEPVGVLREHRFVDETALRLPGGSRRAQVEAFEELGRGLGEQWARHVDGYAEVWELLRSHYFEQPWRPDTLTRETAREVAAVLGSRDNLRRRLHRAFRDDRPAVVAAHPFVADGHDLRDVPAWAGLTTYLEQLFGAWTLPGGMHRLGDLLVDRLATRGVTVLTQTPATDLVVRQGRVAAVTTPSGEVEAEVVVCAIDPRRLPTLAPYVERTMPALPPVVAHVGLDGTPDDTHDQEHPVPDLPHELVLHGDPFLVVRPGGTAPPGGTAWTLHGRGRLAEDMLHALARSGIDVRDRVVARVDRTPREVVQDWGGSPYGVLWQGRGTVRRRLGPTTPVAGVYAAGAHATPGAGLAFVGLSAAQVAAEVGPA